MDQEQAWFELSDGIRVPKLLVECQPPIWVPYGSIKDVSRISFGSVLAAIIQGRMIAYMSLVELAKAVGMSEDQTEIAALGQSPQGSIARLSDGRLFVNTTGLINVAKYVTEGVVADGELTPSDKMNVARDKIRKLTLVAQWMDRWNEDFARSPRDFVTVAFLCHIGLFKTNDVGPTDNRRVYFVQRPDGHIKIGVSCDTKKRVRGLETQGGHALKHLGEMAGGLDAEGWLHDRFASARRIGEWFEPTEELLAFIRENAVRGMRNQGSARLRKPLRRVPRTTS
jgi:hypothetical protein